MDAEKKSRNRIIKWVIIGVISGIAIAGIVSICSALLKVSPDGTYVGEKYCPSEYYTGEEKCHLTGYGQEEECEPVIECPGGFKTRNVSMAEYLKSSLKINFPLFLLLATFAGYLTGITIENKLVDKESNRKFEEEYEKRYKKD